MQESSKARGAQASSSHPTNQEVKQSEFVKLHKAAGLMAMVVMFGANLPQTGIVNLGYLNTIPALQPRIMRFSSEVRKSRTLSH